MGFGQPGFSVLRALKDVQQRAVRGPAGRGAGLKTGVPVPGRAPSPSAARVPTGGRRSLARPRFFSVGDVRFAALRAAVPTGGRRSKPFPRFFSVGDVR